jgi:hypothetical protein
MSRLATLLSVFVLGLGAAACGDNKSGGDASGSPGVNPSNAKTSETQPTTLGSTVPPETTTTQEASPPATTEPTP